MNTMKTLMKPLPLLLFFGAHLPLWVHAAPATSCDDKTPKRVAVLGLEGDAPTALVHLLNEELASALQGVSCYTIVNVSDLPLSLRYDGLAYEVGCNDAACRARVDETLKRVDLIAGGYLRRQSQSYSVSLVVLDARTRESVGRFGPRTITDRERMEAELRLEVRNGVDALARPRGPGQPKVEAEPGGMREQLALLTLRDAAGQLTPPDLKSLTTVLFVQLSQNGIVDLVPQQSIEQIEQRLKAADRAGIARQASARYVLETEHLAFSESDCVIAGTLVDLDRGVTRLASRVQTRCTGPARADAMERLSRQIIEALTPPTKSHWPAWVSGIAAVAGGVVGGIHLMGAVDDVQTRNAAADIDAYRAANDSASEKTLISNIGFGVAGVGIAVAAGYLISELFSGGSPAPTALSWTQDGALVRF